MVGTDKDQEKGKVVRVVVVGGMSDIQQELATWLFHAVGADVVKVTSKEIVADNVPAHLVGFLRNNLMWELGIYDSLPHMLDLNPITDKSVGSDRLSGQLNKSGKRTRKGKVTW